LLFGRQLNILTPNDEIKPITVKNPRHGVSGFVIARAVSAY
jgi:hypothetical protein